MYKIIITTLFIGVLGVDSNLNLLNKEVKGTTPCYLDINKVNDSTVVVSNNSQPYNLEYRILLGNPTVIQSNDTIKISGSNYSITFFASVINSECLVQKIISKFL